VPYATKLLSASTIMSVMVIPRSGIGAKKLEPRVTGRDHTLERKASRGSRSATLTSLSAKAAAASSTLR